jgi:DtxR family Mn-dependent transcriptional regulator
MAEINLSEAMEDYLKTIYLLEIMNKVARVSDIGRQLNVKKASVVAAVGYLQKNELIKHERYAFITLTDKGRELAGVLNRKNSIITEFLIDVLKVESEKAKKEACGMEHSISLDTIEKIASLNRHSKPIPVKIKNQVKKPLIKKKK